MFDELNKYDYKNHFILNQGDSLAEVCNAPTDKSGVYIVYALKGGKIELIYIGSSGHKEIDLSIFVRNTGIGGIKDRIVNGLQKFDNENRLPRRKAWINQMRIQQHEALDVYWYVTHDAQNFDCPVCVERAIFERYIDIYGKRPKWNKMKVRNCKHK